MNEFYVYSENEAFLLAWVTVQKQILQSLHNQHTCFLLLYGSCYITYPKAHAATC